MEQRLRLVTRGFGALARACRFYEEGLGWRRDGGVEGEVAFYQLGGMILALWGRDELAADARLELAPVTPGGSFGGLARPEERRGGKECVRTCRSPGSP